LVVDDDPSVLRLVKTILERGGYVTEEARDGRDALGVLESRSFDVIVSDINMPGYGGMEFLRGVRERDLETPVILLTGKPTLETSNRAMAFGAFRYLLKPIAPKVLTEAVESAVEASKVERLKRAALELHEEEAKLLGDRAKFEARFDSAIDKLWMAFQPIVSWRDRKAYGYEALMRSDELSLSNPAAILAGAERLGRLRDVDRSVRAKLGSAKIPSGSLLFVNLHANDLLDQQLYSPNGPLSCFAERVVLEMTERASFDQIKDLDQRVAQLRALGFKIAVDDLGAGYAGMTTLTQLEPDIAKLDMSLIRNIDKESKKQSVVRSLVTLCRELKIDVVAEGVETPAERDTLVDMGCDYLQGYLFGRPGRLLTPPAF